MKQIITVLILTFSFPLMLFSQVWPDAKAFKWEAASEPGHAELVNRFFQEEWLFYNSDSLDIICDQVQAQIISDQDTLIKVINKSYTGQIDPTIAYDDWLVDMLWVVPQGSNSHIYIDYGYSESAAVRVASSDSMGVNWATGYGPGLDFVHPARCGCQSGASPRVAAKLLTIKRRLAENRSVDIDSVGWHEVLYRARMTATQTPQSHNADNSFYRDNFPDKLYNEINGFGLVNIDSALAFTDSIPSDPLIANAGGQKDYFGISGVDGGNFPRIDSLTGNEKFVTHNRTDKNVEISVRDISRYIGSGIITALPKNNVFIDARGNSIYIDSLENFTVNGIDLATHEQRIDDLEATSDTLIRQYKLDLSSTADTIQNLATYEFDAFTDKAVSDRVIAAFEINTTDTVGTDFHFVIQDNSFIHILPALAGAAFELEQGQNHKRWYVGDAPFTSPSRKFALRDIPKLNVSNGSGVTGIPSYVASEGTNGIWLTIYYIKP